MTFQFKYTEKVQQLQIECQEHLNHAYVMLVTMDIHWGLVIGTIPITRPWCTVCFFEVHFFGSFGWLAVQASQFLAVYGRQVCVGILGSNFF
jgi:hypothetical protein